MSHAVNPKTEHDPDWSMSELAFVLIVILVGAILFGLISIDTVKGATPEAPATERQEKPEPTPFDDGTVVNVGDFMTAEIHGIYRHGANGNPDTLVDGKFPGTVHESVRKRFEPYAGTTKFRVLSGHPQLREKLKPFDGKKVAVMVILTVGDLNLDGEIIRPHVVVAGIKELK